MEKLLPLQSMILYNHRSGEIKFGEKMHTVPKDTDPITF
jgi:formiminoglutamase